MTDQEISNEWKILNDTQQVKVNRLVSIIKTCGADHFYSETGCTIDRPDVFWTLKAFAMDKLGLIDSRC